MTHVRGLGPVLAVPAVVDHQHPAAMRRGRRIGPQQLQPPRIHLVSVPPGLGQEELQPLHRRMLRAGHRLGPANAVSVLFRSRGASNPARYSRNPRRCARRLNRSSNRAAYSSSGPGAAGQGRCRVITHPQAPHKHYSRHTANPLQSQQTTARGS